MEITMYDTLLQLPLFQGLCKDDFTSIIEKVKFHFHQYKTGDTLFNQGDTCNRLVFLLDGSISSHTLNSEQNYYLTEVHHGPLIIEPYSLFGMQTTYTATYKAHSDVRLLTIEKSYILSDLNHYEIFRINYLNILSNRCQYLANNLYNIHIGSLSSKFIDFFNHRCIRPTGEKDLHITMEDLASLIGETRINVSKLLNELQEKGLIQLRRKEIFIPSLEKLAEELGN